MAGTRATKLAGGASCGRLVVELPKLFFLVGASDNSMFHGVFENQKVLVTGHTGFKGSWLSQWLTMCGAEVHGYSLDPPSHATFFEQLQLADRLASDNRGDITEALPMHDLVQSIEPRFVFHLAAQPLVRAAYANPVETFKTNVLGTVHVLEALRGLTKPCSTIVVTTDKCYQNLEWLHGYRECAPLGGVDPYSASKAAAELVSSSYRDSFFSDGPVRIASARAGNVIGGGDWAVDRIIPDCIRSFQQNLPVRIRNPHSTRPWQHVLEPLSGYLWLAAKLDLTYAGDLPQSNQGDVLDRSFNFGPTLESNRTVVDLVEAMLPYFPGSRWTNDGDDAAAHPHEASRLDLSIAKAHHLLGWTPVWDFEQTIGETARWYRSSAEGANMKDVTLAQINDYCDSAVQKDITWTKAAPSQAMAAGNQPTAA